MSSPDLFTQYFRLYEHTEPPIIYHRWSFITCLSAYLGRQFWMPYGPMRVFPNFYTMLIGSPGARKSTAIKLGKKLFSACGYDMFAAEKTSKEKFLLDLEGVTEDDLSSAMRGRGKRKTELKGLTHEEIMENLFGSADKNEVKVPREVFVVADEFNEFVGTGNLEFLSLLGMLWDWDDENTNYKQRLKNSKSVSIFQPTITILSGNTHEGFKEAIPPQALGQGFLSRLVLVYGEPSGRKIATPIAPSNDAWEGMRQRLLEIKKTVVGPATETKEAVNAREILYGAWRPMEDSRFSYYAGRRHIQCIKLSLICAAVRGSTEINETDVVYANTILSYTENDMPKALGEFGKSKDGDIANKIMQHLYAHAHRPTPVGEIFKIVKNDIDKNQQLVDIMGKLINTGQVQMVPGQGYLPKQKILDSSQVFLDFTMLKEYQQRHGPVLRRVQ